MINQIKTVLLLGILTAIMLFIGSLFGTTGLTIALILVLGMNLISYFFSHKIVLAIYRAKEASKKDYPKLHAIVENVARKAGIPKPKVYIIPSDNLNAFASGRNPKNAVVACTEGILRVLNEKELEGVLAHEVSHVKNRDILIGTIAATIAGVITYVAHMARFAAIFGGGRDREGNSNIIGLLLISIIAPIAAMIIQLAISRAREYHADESGAKLLKDGEGLASALLKLEKHNKMHPMRFGSPSFSHLFISNPLSGGGLVNLFLTHPPIHLRVKKLRELSKSFG
ncbi:MAG TPA: zinc metalloprotease HtpX [Candidatus Nanoarchaeia archaeon]|nr:zinc metalloprotease HtpX [Candidatus Nanoarchaeia archaeon]